jgi:hypothetical protein
MYNIIFVLQCNLEPRKRARCRNKSNFYELFRTHGLISLDKA